MRRHTGRVHKLSDFIHFTDEKTTLLNDPLFSKGAVSRHNNEKKERFD